MVLPRPAASGAISLRIQSASADAMGQRRMAAGFTETLPLVRQHDRLQPHQVLAAAATGAMDIGNAGRNGDGVGQRQPAGRWLRRRLRCGRGLLLGLILALLSGLVGLLLPAGGSGSADGASAGRGFGSGTGTAARRTFPRVLAAHP